MNIFFITIGGITVMKNNDLIIVLYDIRYRDPFSVITALVTGSSYSHGSLCIEDTDYETTMLVGKFDRFDINKYKEDRELTLIRIPEITGIEWLEDRKKNGIFNLAYDIVGLLLWPFNIHNKNNKEYCFEAINSCLSYYGKQVKDKDDRISGKHIFNKFINDNEVIILRSNVKNYEKDIKLLRNIPRA